MNSVVSTSVESIAPILFYLYFNKKIKLNINFTKGIVNKFAKI